MKTLGPNERFEADAALYYKRFRRLAPGKSEPIGTYRNSCDPENWDQKEKWQTSGQHYEDALAEIVRLQEKVEELEERLEEMELLRSPTRE
jgi:hypothetical protein